MRLEYSWRFLSVTIFSKHFFFPFQIFMVLNPSNFITSLWHWGTLNDVKFISVYLEFSSFIGVTDGRIIYTSGHGDSLHIAEVTPGLPILQLQTPIYFAIWQVFSSTIAHSSLSISLSADQLWSVLLVPRSIN